MRAAPSRMASRQRRSDVLLSTALSRQDFHTAYLAQRRFEMHDLRLNLARYVATLPMPFTPPLRRQAQRFRHIQFDSVQLCSGR